MDVLQGWKGFGLGTQEQMAGHAQVHQQGGAAFQGKDQVLAAAGEVEELPAHQPFLQFPDGRLPAQGLFPGGDPEKAAAHQPGGQTLSDNFYLGKFRHRFEFRVSSWLRIGALVDINRVTMNRYF